jgi:hypothetical protein
LEIEEGIASFVNFTNDALQVYYQRRIADGASWEPLPESPAVAEPFDDRSDEHPKGD